VAKTKESRRHPHPRARVPAHNANLGATSGPYSYSQPVTPVPQTLVRVWLAATRHVWQRLAARLRRWPMVRRTRKLAGAVPCCSGWLKQQERHADLSTGSFASGAQPDFELALNTNTHVNPLQSEGLGEKHTLVCDVSAAAGGAPAAAAPNPRGNMVASESERGAHCP
jgi:hypothetical protein